MVENADAALATIAACGSSFCSSAAADAATALAADAAMTVVCGSSFCSSAAADVAMDAAALTADANSITGRSISLRPLHFVFIQFLAVLLRLFQNCFFQMFSQHTILINLVHGIAVNNQFPIHIPFPFLVSYHTNI